MISPVPIPERMIDTLRRSNQNFLSTESPPSPNIRKALETRIFGPPLTGARAIIVLCEPNG
jgi:hypothetical protein